MPSEDGVHGTGQDHPATTVDDAHLRHGLCGSALKELIDNLPHVLGPEAMQVEFPGWRRVHGSGPEEGLLLANPSDDA